MTDDNERLETQRQVSQSAWMDVLEQARVLSVVGNAEDVTAVLRDLWGMFIHNEGYPEQAQSSSILARLEEAIRAI